VNFNIESGIPAPTPGDEKRHRWQRLFKAMNVGDSVVLSKEEAKRFSAAVNGFGPYMGFKVVTEVQPEGTTRCWLIGRGEE
jgi:hypothetical protein